MVPAVTRIVESAVASLGLEIVDVELANRGRMLRVFIDRPDSRPDDPLSGISVEDCERVTRQLQRVLPVEGIEYDRLEVSSPGLDRVLRTREHFNRFAGFAVDVRLRLPQDGRRRYTGVLRGVAAEGIELDVDGVQRSIRFTDIDVARLVAQVNIGAGAKPGAANATKQGARRERAQGGRQEKR